MQNIIIATIKEWNIAQYFSLKKSYAKQYNFHLVTDKKELNSKYLNKLQPKYIFFPHWSWIIDMTIYEQYECVVFHMTDLPFGRGGSPLQNLIQRGIYDTKITALKVSENIDAGDIYFKESFNIKDGSAEDNYKKLAFIIFTKMIPVFLTQSPIATKQIGEVVKFTRREACQSNIELLEKKSITKLYDFIRMLDAPDYPQAYIELGNVTIKFAKVQKDESKKKLLGVFEVIENE